VTGGSENPEVTCDNCKTSISKAKLNLHMAYCLKNVKKCPHCNKPCDLKELDKHISENSGDLEKIKAAIISFDYEKLKSIKVHSDTSNYELIHFIAAQPMEI
jgi:NAD-dependent SIR2 family protein deacetylase